MNNPKEKARELVEKFIEPTQEWDELDGYVASMYRAKQCALIACDELIINSYSNYIEDYWQQVKQEIKKL
jgi:hypothetical protein